jgi:hypothetical protein
MSSVHDKSFQNNPLLRIAALLLFAVFIALIAALGAYNLLYWQFQQQSKNDKYGQAVEMMMRVSPTPDPLAPSSASDEALMSGDGTPKEYVNEQLKFAFTYPAKYGTITTDLIRDADTSGGLAYEFHFTKMCDTCTPGLLNTRNIPLQSPNIIQMGAANAQFTPETKGRPQADFAGFTRNADGSVSFKGKQTYTGISFKTFEAIGTEGLELEFDEPTLHLHQTSIVFNLKSSVVTGYEFMTHDKIGENTNARNLEEVAKTFRLLK